MHTIISIKGKNERMGKLFKTPKHNLLFNGRPALIQTIEYMSKFGDVKVMTHENSPPDTGIVDMLCQMDLPDKFFVVDCDVIPLEINHYSNDRPVVYCFENKNGLVGYSNFDVDEKTGTVIRCNEKGEVYKWAGAGIYYFSNPEQVKKYRECKSLSEIMSKQKTLVDTTSKIFRFGSLQTILNNELEF